MVSKGFLRISVLAVLGIALVAGVALAGPLVPVKIGDLITISDALNHDPNFSGGAFTVSGPGYNFDTFCIESQEYLDLSDKFKIVGIQKVAVYGGIGGGPLGDPLSLQTGWLFSNFWNGTLVDPVTHVVYTGTGADQDLLQQALWLLEQESLGVSNHWDQNALGPANALNNVWVLNLEWTVDAYGYHPGDRAQDLLVMTPEPSLALLLGMGLAGVAALVGRRKSK